MGVFTIFILLFVVIAAIFLGMWAYGRSMTRAVARDPKGKTGNRPEQWGVRISAPASERACPQIRERLGKEFPMAEKPQLPLPDCPFPHQCECRYIRLLDHRLHERRSGDERRSGGQRFEKGKTPRRSGKDRRKKVDWF
jgi:hypothetical protein